MTKRRTKQEKKLAELRRENEILKAQLSSAKKEVLPPSPSKEFTQKGSTEVEVSPFKTNIGYLKADLSKTLLLTALLISLLSLLASTQSQWPQITNAVSFILKRFTPLE